ncbi:phage holin family protein [Shewanella sp.]|uniref:phage holin family protein n=1 Tax=Shewanella sp. TaxID=50422 RepID=UPI003A96BED6
MTILNALICLAIALRLALFVKSGYRPWISWLAYLLTVACGSQAIIALLHVGCATHWSVLLTNAVLAVLVFSSNGNLAELFKSSARYSRISQVLLGKR